MPGREQASDARTDSVRQRWDALYAQRLGWAEDARQEYLATLDPQVLSNFGGQGSDVSIVLYGPTQVGKTTLILRLLGLADETTAEAHDVLRGGRTEGSSATATAMRYRLTDGGHWSWRDGSELLPSASGEQIRDRLERLRRSVAEGSRGTHRPVDIGIPGTLRAEEPQGPALSILDLPGIQAAEAAEQRHVKDLAARYLPNADLIVLIGRADNLEFLKPEVLELPGLLDWWRTPERYRLVLTHALTLGSVADWARGRQGSLGLADIRQHHVEQLETFARDFQVSRDVVSPILFPLDYGKSWVQMRGTHEADRLEAGNVESFTALRDTLAASTRPEARIAQAHRAHLVAVQVMTHRRDEAAAASESASAHLESARQRVSRREALVDDARTVAAARRRAADECALAAANPPPRPHDPGFGDRLHGMTGDGIRREYYFRRDTESELRSALDARIQEWAAWAEPWVGYRSVADATAGARDAREHLLAHARTEIEQAWRWGGLFSLFEQGSSDDAIARAVEFRGVGIERIDRCHSGLAADLAREAARLREAADAEDSALQEAERRANQARYERDASQSQVDDAQALLQERLLDLEAVQGEADAFADTLAAALRERTRADLAGLGAAATDDERGLLALNHLLTLKTYDVIRRDA